jgi:NADH-quinone oxidoreductase subunit F
MGTGTLVLLDDKTCPVGMTLNMMEFFAQESCGWCTPCREGLQWAAYLLREIEEGRGKLEDLDVLAEQVWFMASDKCFCDLAPGATQPLEAALRLFRDDFVAHLKAGRCPYAPAEADESAGAGLAGEAGEPAEPGAAAAAPAGKAAG